MNCQKFREQLNSYVDGETPADLAAELEAHALGCTACGRELEEVRRMKSLVAALPRYQPPDDVSRRVMDRLRGESATKVRPLRWAAAAVAAVLVGALTLAIVHYSRHPARTAREPGQPTVKKPREPGKEDGMKIVIRQADPPEPPAADRRALYEIKTKEPEKVALDFVYLKYGKKKQIPKDARIMIVFEVDAKSEKQLLELLRKYDAKAVRPMVDALRAPAPGEPAAADAKGATAPPAAEAGRRVRYLIVIEPEREKKD